MAEEPTIEQFKTQEIKLPQQFEIAVLPLQNTTLFPETVVPLAVGRERSTRAVESALATEGKLLACITTRTENVTGDDAKYDDLFKIGTIVNIKRMMRNEGILQLIVQGIDRFEVLEWTGEQPYLKSKLVTGKFFMERMLPETSLRLSRIQTGAASMMELPAEAF